MSVASRVACHLRLLLAPAPCLGCGRPQPEAAPALSLCVVCRGRLRELRGPACEGCGRPLGPARPGAAGAGRCVACARHPPPFARLIALWSYEPPLDAVVHALKFRRLDYLGEHLAALAAGPLSPAAAGADGVVAVPLHWRRRWARGYDQAALIAAGLARRWGLPRLTPLRRVRPTPPQSRLGREERAANLRGAFAVIRPAQVAGRQLVLVDDVVTTGTTLAAAAAALRQAGARFVWAAALARTPAADDPPPGQREYPALPWGWNPCSGSLRRPPAVGPRVDRERADRL